MCHGPSNLHYLGIPFSGPHPAIFPSKRYTLKAFVLTTISRIGPSWSTARIPLAEVFHFWVRWEGPGSGFESSCGVGGIWKSEKSCNSTLPLWDQARKNRISNALGHNKSKVSGAWAETEHFHTDFSTWDPPLCEQIMRVAGWGSWTVWVFPGPKRSCYFSKLHFFCRILKTWEVIIFPKHQHVCCFLVCWKNTFLDSGLGRFSKVQYSIH